MRKGTLRTQWLSTNTVFSKKPLEDDFLSWPLQSTYQENLSDDSFKEKVQNTSLYNKGLKRKCQKRSVGMLLEKDRL